MDLINQLKKNGYRVTTSREIICKILEESGHEHFTADNLFKLARKYSKEIDLATIYRTFELLEELNIIEHSHQAHSSPYDPCLHTLLQACQSDSVDPLPSSSLLQFVQSTTGLDSPLPADDSLEESIPLDITY